MKQLPRPAGSLCCKNRLLMTGLWPEAIRVLLTLALQLEVPNSRLERVLKSMERRTNRFGLIKPEDVGSILSSLSVEGMSFAMLRDVIHKMRIQMPEQDIKRMFDLMDINHDLSLSLSELLSGFEVLFGRFMPLLVLQEVGLSLDRMLLVLCLTTLGLLAFFGFLGLAFSSFEVHPHHFQRALAGQTAVSSVDRHLIYASGTVA